MPWRSPVSNYVSHDNVESARQRLRRASRWVIAVFWFVQFTELTLVSFVEGNKLALQMLEPRILVLACGVVLTLVFVEIAARLDRHPFRSRLVYTGLAALACCLVLVTINYFAFLIHFHLGQAIFDLTDYVYTAFSWSWFFFSMAGAVLALSYSIDSREREQRLAALEVSAQEFRMTALRYQLNPHFLFNTLNSIAALVGKKDAVAAEQMVENLSDFLRATLELDPLLDVTLDKEVSLQALYLAIEQVRFSTRLRTRYVVPDGLKRALVPSLITQPLVENAIRHAVARSLEPVTITISARREGERLVMAVEDDGAPSSHMPTPGTGVGSSNVRNRLEQRFGTEQSFLTGPLADGGYRAEIQIPLRMAGAA